MPGPLLQTSRLPGWDLEGTLLKLVEGKTKKKLKLLGGSPEFDTCPSEAEFPVRAWTTWACGTH